MKKAADPEKVANGVNWVFSAVSNFLKIRKKEQGVNTPAPLPPEPEAEHGELPAEIDDLEVEAKSTAVNAIAKKLEQEEAIPLEKGVPLLDLKDFEMDQLASETESLLKQISTYLNNLHFEEEKAAQFGGVTFAPPIVMNTIRIQQQEVAKRVVRLNQCMQKAYGVAAPDLEVLIAASQN
ncbi:hypothetical protein ACFFUR_01210 [Echinicola jeungdonensis]|uniref:Uncharacterized protein n=2 Tax=Echinicola jeungdonensis TaxID=709343 RepID=A0ABV5J0R8_9BACT